MKANFHAGFTAIRMFFLLPGKTLTNISSNLFRRRHLLSSTLVACGTLRTLADLQGSGKPPKAAIALRNTAIRGSTQVAPNLARPAVRSHTARRATTWRRSSREPLPCPGMSWKRSGTPRTRFRSTKFPRKNLCAESHRRRCSTAWPIARIHKPRPTNSVADQTTTRNPSMVPIRTLDPAVASVSPEAVATSRVFTAHVFLASTLGAQQVKFRQNHRKHNTKYNNRRLAACRRSLVQ